MSFIRVATDMVITLEISFMIERCGKRCWDYLEGSIFDVRIVDGGPKSGTGNRVCDFEVGIILMPVCAASVSGRF